MKSTPRFAAALLLAAFLHAPGPALASHDWSGYHWSRSGSSLSLRVGDNVTSAWDGYLDVAIADWHASNVLTLTEVAGSLNPRRCRGVTGRIDVCNAGYGNNGWLGIAQIWLSGGHIVKGITKLNDTYFATGSYNTPAWRRFVTCQELGHDFGLAHVNETFNDPNGGAGGVSPSDPSNEHPNAHDYNLLASKYVHTHSSAATAEAAFPPAADQLDLNHRASWGRLVAHAPGHGVETYELDFGGGKKLVTHVTWTLETAAKRRAEEKHEHQD